MTQVELSLAQRLRVPLMLIGMGVLAACDPAPQPVDEPVEPGLLQSTRNGPADAPEGSCWGKTISRAVVERVSTQVQIKAAKVNNDGTIASAPVYRTEEKQVIVTPRRDNWFETPCPEVLTPEFISSLQRAMQARGDYTGEISGIMDSATRSAIRRIQFQDGLDSSVLSLEVSRELGLVAVPRDPVVE